MAYRFLGSSNERVRFAISPLQGYTFGAGTFAVFLKRAVGGLGASNFFLDVTDSSDAYKALFYFGNDETIRILCGSNVSDGTVGDTTNWLLLAVSFPSSGTARFHIHNGTSWTHTNVSAVGSLAVIGATDKLMFGANDSPSSPFWGDAACCGIKKSDSTDLQVETLSRTAFQSWKDFGFDWLIGFDSTLEAAGILQDQASPGTGDETAISGTSVVANPPGWSYALSGGGGGGGAILEHKAGAASVDVDDYNALVDAVVALGGSVATRKAGSGAVSTVDYNAIVTAVVALGGSVATRKAGSGQVNTADYNAVVDAVKLLGAP